MARRCSSGRAASPVETRERRNIDEELTNIGNTGELAIATRQADSTLRPFVTIWVVRAGDDLYVRSVKGRSGTWFRRALAAGGGRIQAGGVERDVAFEEAGSETQVPVTAAYHEKYDRYGPSVVGTVVSAESAKTTLRLVPMRRPGGRLTALDLQHQLGDAGDAPVTMSATIETKTC
jgi:hypothetical protein